MEKIKDKKIIITGATSGIGEQIAYEIAKKGAIPILIARREEKLKQISQKYKKTQDLNALHIP